MPGRLLSSFVALAAAVSGLVLTQAPAAAAVPPQEPGVTLRVYDMQVELSKLCTLKAGQTPNVDKLLPTINWSGTEFGVNDFFVSEVTANLNIATAGSYAFRLTSDDGSRLRIDDAVVDQPRRAARADSGGGLGHPRRRLPRPAHRPLRQRGRPAGHARVAAAGGERVRGRAQLGAEHRRRRRSRHRAGPQGVRGLAPTRRATASR